VSVLGPGREHLLLLPEGRLGFVQRDSGTHGFRQAPIMPLRGDFQRLARRLDSFREPARLGIGGGQRIEKHGIAPARQLHRPPGQCGRLGTVSHRRVGVGGQRVGGPVECQQMVGLDAQGLAPLDDGFRRPAAKVVQGAPQIVTGVGIPGSQRDGLFEMRNRLVRPALRNQGESEIVVDLGQAGVDRQRLFEMRDRLVESAPRRKDARQEVMRLSRFRIGRQGLV